MVDVPPSLRIGQVTITRIEESVFTIPIDSLIPPAIGESLDELRPSLGPNQLAADNTIGLAIAAFVVESEGRRILIDTCIGTEHDHGNPESAFLRSLTSAGFDPATVDAVVCTHSHFDHVGWNTRVIDGARRPTFDNATYYLSDTELDHARSTGDSPETGGFDHVAASIDPLIEAGVCTRVSGSYHLGSHLTIEPTPGHSPGHVALFISSDDQHAVITGDLFHHPVQLARPEWHSGPDWDRAQAAHTRRAFVDRVIDQPIIVIGSHLSGAWCSQVREIDGLPTFGVDPEQAGTTNGATTSPPVGTMENQT
jgi:glyoxylase-like metal-dependent hydrolase (beta-lactamase superfamily II)